MSLPPNATWWVPGPLHRQIVGVWKAWVLVLAVTLAVAIGVLSGFAVQSIFETPYGTVIVSSPRDCRVGGDLAAPQLYIAVDASRIRDSAYLLGASSLGLYGRKVAAISVLPSLPPLSSLDDAEVVRLADAGESSPEWAEGDPPTGVILAVVDVGASRNGTLDGLTTRWSLGEPAAAQDLPLGITFTPTTCTVTRTP